MVTASAPVVPDPHALATAAATAALNSTAPPISFLSVYQSLPLPDKSTGTAVAALPSGKEPLGTSKGIDGNKKDPSDSANKQPTIATLSPVPDLPPQRPWVPSPPAFSRTAQAPTVEPLPLPLASAHIDSKPPTIETPELATAATPVPPAPKNSIKIIAANAFARPAAAKTLIPAVAAKTLETALPPSVRDQASNLAQTAPAVSPAPPLPLGSTAAPAGKPTGPASLIAAGQRQKASFNESITNVQTPSGNPLAPTAVLPVSLPGLTQRLTDPSRDTAAGAKPQPGFVPAVTGKGLTASIVPRTENLAFSLRMMDPESPAHQAHATPQPTPQPTPVRAQPSTEAKVETKNDSRSTPPARTTTASRPLSFEQTSRQASNEPVDPSWNQPPASSRQDMSAEVHVFETPQPAHASLVSTLHEVQPALPEAPKPNTTGQILLQLGGKEQSAAIRVSERAGTVNVSVHSADPELRSSLRSNLGELASQLTHQGWKTEVVRSGTVLTRPENPHDSSSDGQRSSQQQQSSPNGERQPQRERRANNGQWLADLEEFESGSSGNPGGRN